MDWVTCPQCGFTQIPTGRCLRCGRPLPSPDAGSGEKPVTFVPVGPARDPAATRVLTKVTSESGEPASTETDPDRTPPDGIRPAASVAAEGAPSADAAPATPGPAAAPPPGAASPAAAGAGPPPGTSKPARPRPRPPASPAPPPAAAPAPPRRGGAIAAVTVGAILVLGLALFLARKGQTGSSVEASPTPAPTPVASLDLSGRWQVELSKSFADPPRPVLKQAFLETDRDGAILAAGVVLTDPGRGGAGAGYRIASNGPQRLGDVSAALTASPAGATLPQIDFIPLPAWVPARERVWRVLEGQNRKIMDVRYLLLESVEDDYLVQAGINQSGFLSYAFFSKPYARGRGLDALSGIIHPEPGSDLRGFRNLVWDFSGAADFLTLEVGATLSGPEGGAVDRLTLKRPAQKPAS